MKRLAFTMLRGAFTMAEILLSLTIIGVVAAITLPSLTGNINERTWNTQRKALYARMSQAIALMPSLNGFGTYVAEVKDANGSITTSGQDNVAETFVAAGLSKVLKINNICDNEHLEDCGIPSKIIQLDGGSNSGSHLQLEDIKTLYGFNSNFSRSGNVPDTKAVAFETANGESVLAYYYPNCKPDMNETWSYDVHVKVCVNFVYDLNGTKGPNTVGKDIGFVTALYPTDPNVISVMPLGTTRNWGYMQDWEMAKKLCSSQNEEGRMPTRDEMIALFANQRLFGYNSNVGYWTGSLVSGTSAWEIGFIGYVHPDDDNAGSNVLCIKR